MSIYIIFHPSMTHEFQICSFMLQVLDSEEDSRTQRVAFRLLHSPGTSI